MIPQNKHFRFQVVNVLTSVYPVSSLTINQQEGQASDGAKASGAMLC